MRWQHVAAGLAAVGMLFMACSGAERSEDEGSDFNGPGGGSKPDVTQLCEEQCAPIYPAGETDYRASRVCVLCDACYNVCLAEGVDLSMCPDELEAPAGCSASSATCADCVAGMCALFQDPATTLHTGLCAPQGDICVNNPDCVGMTNCVASCVENTPPAM